jgi:hypothetical protein
LALFGLIGAFDLAKSSALEYVAAHSLQTGLFTVYLTTAHYFLKIVVSSAGFPFVVAWVYLFKYHASWVNTLRVSASEFLPSVTIQMNYLPDTELEWLTHPERLPILARQRYTHLGAWMDSPTGHKAMLVICLLVVFICLVAGALL